MRKRTEMTLKKLKEKSLFPQINNPKVSIRLNGVSIRNIDLTLSIERATPPTK
jgi:hypothetical protein